MEPYKTISLIISAFTLGIAHSLDADHIATMSAYVSKSKSFKRSAVLGVFWGSGHTLALMTAGLLLLLFRISIPDFISVYVDYLIGFFLVYMGFRIIQGMLRQKTHIHIHEHDGKKHLHFHSHAESRNHNHNHKTFLIGLMHGLAGSSSVMLIIVSSIDSLKLGVFYILLFGLGTISGMLAFSGLLWLTFYFSFKRFPDVNKAAAVLAAAFCLIVGVEIMLF